ncbi:MAG: GTP-binding protein [Chloroflexi bacterium]|nr:GTP-binding protein [Chloroflexota bacterium]
MGSTYKVVVTGHFNVGKTEFIRAISDIPVISTERRISDHLRAIKDETTVAMDYGQVRLGNDLFHLHGTPGQPRFDFMWDILSKEMDAFIVLVDSCDRETLLRAKRLIRIFRRKSRVPYLVVANKQDKDGAMSVRKISKALGLEGKASVVPCVAKKKSSARKVLEELKTLVD